METVAIREKLCDYIRHADDEKVKAMYTLLEDSIEQEYHWWEDDAFVAELDKEYEAIERGEAKAYTWEELQEMMRQRKQDLYGEV